MMKDENKTKEQLINELVELRQRITALEKLEAIVKEAEEALRKSEDRFRTFLDNLGDIAYTTDCQGNITYVNKITEKIVGIPLEDIIEKPFLPLFTEESQRVAIDVYQRTLNGESPEYELTLTNGRIYHFKNEPLRDKDGKIIGVFGIARDITERKQAEEVLRKAHGELEILVNERTAELIKSNKELRIEITERKLVEEALQESQQLLEALVGTAPILIVLADSDGRIRMFNSACEELTGYKREEVVGKKLTELLVPSDWIPIIQKRFADPYAPEVKAPHENPWITRSGEERLIEWRCAVLASPEDSKSYILGVGINITERKHAEKALRESEERYRRMVSAVTAYTYSVEVSEGQVVSTQHSMGCLPITGYSPEQYVSDPYLWYSMIYPDDRMKVDNSIKDIMAGLKVLPVEHRLTRSDGSIIWVRNTLVPYYDNGGRLIKYDGLIEDITTRKQFEEALWASEQKYRDLYDNAPDMYHTLDKNGIIIDCNATEAKALGYKKEEIIGKPVADFFTEESKRLLMKDFPRLNEENKLLNIEREFVRKDGTTFPAMLNVFSKYDENGNFLQAMTISRDITERKKLEEQLLHSQKMEAIGQLAGGIAHDFNNILTAIIGFGTLLKIETEKDDHLHSYVTQILTSAERAANLTQSLLTFSRRQIISPKPFNLNEIIQGLDILLSRVIGEDIELSIVLTDKDLIIMADSGQIEQVLMNFATNSRDAMPDGGKLIISTNLAHLDSEFVKAHGFGRPGAYALVSVEDTGKGIDEKTKERIFEPFFTTKEVGKGTGLGLAIVYGIIKQHDGYIDLYSERGIGTRFDIYLPLITSEVEETELADRLFLRGGNETVLVAEDDAQVRELISEVLAGFGYTVIEAENGEDAIKVFYENRDKIQLLILDVIIPKKNGKEVYDEIRKASPDIKVIFTSGYDADVIHKKGVIEEGLNFISKPIPPNKLVLAVREVLDK